MPEPNELPLLNYAVQTTPSPLQASRAGRLTIVASNEDPASPITCESISVAIVVGPYASDLTASTAGIVVPQPPGWTASFSGSLYTAKPNGGSVQIINSVPLVIDAIAVNDWIGVTKITIGEKAAQEGKPLKLRTTEITVEKFPPDFVVSHLRAKPDTVEVGGSTVLYWTGTNLPDLATYRLSWIAGGTQHDIPVDYTGPQKIENVDTEPETQFKLEVRVAGLPDPIIKKEHVNVIPAKPVIDRFTGDIEGRRIRLRWAARYGDCYIESRKYDATGEVLLPLDRVSYVLTVRNKTRSTRAVLMLDFTKSAERVEQTAWPMLVAAPNASSLVGVSYRNCVQFDGASLAQRKVLATGQGTTFAAISDDGGLLCVSNTDAGPQSTLTLFDDRAMPIASRKIDGGNVSSMCFSPNNGSLYAVAQPHPSSSSFTLYSFVASTLEPISHQVLTGTAVGALCTSPSGDRVYFAAERILFSLDTRTGSVVTSATDSLMPRSAICWRSGDDVFIALTTIIGTDIYDARTLKKVQREWWNIVTKTAAELLVVTDHLYGVDVIDPATRKLFSTIDIDLRGTYPGPIGYASGVLFAGKFDGGRTTLMRYIATSATLLDLPQVDLLTGDGVLVAVAEAEGPVTIDVDGGEKVRAEAPAGWDVAQESTRFTFTPASQQRRELVAFTFRGTEDGAGVRVVPPAVVKGKR